MREVIVALAVLLAAGACSAGTAGSTTTQPQPTTTTIARSPTTTTAAVTTTTEALDCPRELGIRTDADGAPRRLLPGECYFHQHFDVVSFEFEFEVAEWGLVVSGTRILSLGDAPDQRSVRAVSFISFITDSSQDLIDRLSADDDLEIISKGDGEFAGFDATVLDITVPENVRPNGPFPCNGPAVQDEIITGRTISAFLIGCSENRMWLVDVLDATLVVHIGDITGSLGDVATLDGIEDEIDEFEAATTICTVETPCDD